MTPETVSELARQALWTTVLLVGPVLVVGALAGLFTSVLQAVTQIQEQTLAFVPKLAASIAVLLVLGPWMLRVMIEFTQSLIADLGRFAG
jgi:flagellar biosynthesis protein FliQ